MVHPIQSAAINAAPIAELKQVKNYLTDEKTRAAVLQRVIDDLPHKDDIILIGHSLGSVIAIDLLDNLPSGVHVRRFITIGSPAGSPVLHQGRARILKRFPYSRVDDWSNFLDPADAVTAGKGLAALFPGAQDFMITGATGHRSPSYLRHPAIATLVDQILNPGKDVVIASSAVVPRLTEDQASTLATIEFANHVTDKIDDERANRFEDAVQRSPRQLRRRTDRAEHRARDSAGDRGTQQGSHAEPPPKVGPVRGDRADRRARQHQPDRAARDRHRRRRTPGDRGRSWCSWAIRPEPARRCRRPCRR
ncbi:hypothetical protein MYK68_05425 [Gordonia sp. PP30]|uniref:alpha/beta fold hydrolase n=1 Tax=Gordonia sp. PP30 TaxID=2935861 RepID=UPI001FFFAEA5|nr:alpha/beta fold hydrolase [Gordonia sp. PP30]UQE76035.1 hypothetical protein MYK68_05425 [Gordonia sp. PP30]